MIYRQLGRTGMKVSALSYGASALGDVYGKIDDSVGIRTVHTALDHGINYLDVSPAYGGTKAELVLGKALQGIPRDRYLLSTKVGKYCQFGAYGKDIFDYSAARIRASVDESRIRLGVDYFDLLILHDIEYHGQRHVAQALGEGLDTLRALKREGIIKAIGVATYPMALWHRIVKECDVDVIMTHNHYSLNDTQLETLLPTALMRGIGVISSSALACGLLTERGPASWHPADADTKAVFAKAVAHCRARGTPLEVLAMAFALAHSDIATTLTTTSNPERLRSSIQAATTPIDQALVHEVQTILAPVMNRDWNFGELC